VIGSGRVRTAGASVERAARERGGPLAPWLVLLRPRVAVLVLLSAFVGGQLAAGPAADLLLVVEAALWVTLTAAAASVFNQVLERETDALMPRTAGRPLVTGALRTRDAILFGALLGAVGVAALALRFNTTSALLALAALCLYALVYTPLKRVSTLNTVIGAVPGAMPPLLAATAVGGAPGTWGWLLFAVIFTWQFPHFMAIAWLYREQYARAGMKMLPALPGSEGMAGRMALAYSLVLLPVSLVPATQGHAGPVYALGALALGLVYAAASAAFAHRESRRRARLLLFVSLVYLPLVFSIVLLDPVVALSHGLATP